MCGLRDLHNLIGQWWRTLHAELLTETVAVLGGGGG